MGSDGRPRGIAHIEFAKQEFAVAAVESSTQEPIHMLGRDLRLDFSAGPRSQQNSEPSEKLYFSGCAGDEAEVRSLFQEFGDDIVDIHLCMLFTLSDFVPLTHMDDSKGWSNRPTPPNWFRSIKKRSDGYASVGDP